MFLFSFKGGFGEGHMSSDDEDLADDADATEARKKARQGDDDKFDDVMSDEENDLVKVRFNLSLVVAYTPSFSDK